MQDRHTQTFEELLQQCRGGPWTYLPEASAHFEDQILHLPRAISGRGWSNEPAYLFFLDHAPHRKLLDCFVLDSHQPLWRFDSLLRAVGPGICRMELETALLFAEKQGFVVAQPGSTWWSRGPALRQIRNLGPTFEWLVLELLRRDHSALARRGVVLQELQAHSLGDLDILAFFPTGYALTIECKSSPSGITDAHLARFLRRAQQFPADVALLLFDDDDPQRLHNRLLQLNRTQGPTRPLRGFPCPQGNSQLYAIPPNLYLANTMGGVANTIRSLLTWATVRSVL
jgi:hypothetical protein